MTQLAHAWEKKLLKAVDLVFSLQPQRLPHPRSLHHCKIISHRGEHDNRTVMENTLPAFDRAVAGGVWGVELDLRWSRDLQPMVHHDADLQRLHGKSARLADLSLQELRRDFPMIPTLEEVLARYGRKVHLMVEIKEEPYPQPARQKEILRRLLSPLTPVEDFHILTLRPEMFARVDFLPPLAWVAVGTTNLRTISELALKEKIGGVAGHYLLLSAAMLRKHQGAGQKVGTGYPASRNVLFRELNRGVDWIFSNNAVQIQSFCLQAVATKNRLS